MKATARANTNIALIKYWGKRDEKLFLPMNSSLSITLDRFYTTTTVEFRTDLSEDVFYLNGEKESEEERKKISRFLDKVRSLANASLYARVDSVNNMPTAAGFASSASGYAALAAASSKALDLNLSLKELSILARQGSGSACRSVYGGFVEWRKGEMENGMDSYARPLLHEEAWDLSILSAVVETKKKKISSRDGMRRTVVTSPFYSGWLATVEEDLKRAKIAIAERNFDLLGSVLERNALKMHATTLGANPPFMYWHSATLAVMEEVEHLRSQGISVYYTIDAGPNVKVICERKNEKLVEEALSALPAVQQVYICHPGPRVTFLPSSDGND